MVGGREGNKSTSTRTLALHNRNNHRFTMKSGFQLSKVKYSADIHVGLPVTKRCVKNKYAILSL